MTTEGGTNAPLPARSPNGGGSVRFEVPGGAITGDLTVPVGAIGIVVFAHGSGSGRTSPRNTRVARELERSRIATLLLDLLTGEESTVDAETRRYRFDVPRLATRLVAVIDALSQWGNTAELPVGLYGASTGGAAALDAAAARPLRVAALVLRGARSDLAGPTVYAVRAPTLFLVGELDPEVRRWNEETRSAMSAPTELQVLRGAGHLFEEAGALDEVAARTNAFFRTWLTRSRWEVPR